ncbi:MAG: DUF1700 domain-containing protein [Candidatus Korobacteraceae bacterium]
MTNDALTNDYLARMRAALAGMTLSEREDIVEEIRMHIRERSGDGQGAEEILAGLGPAEQLAEQYRAGLLLQQAQRSISPWVILRATLRGARTGVQGAAVFFIALFGYLMGAGFLLLALLKPIFPRQTGLWVGPGVFDFSFRMGLLPNYPSTTVHEMLGWWLIPVCLIAGSLTVLLTTKLIQFLMKRFRLRLPFAVGARAQSAVMAI